MSSPEQVQKLSLVHRVFDKLYPAIRFTYEKIILNNRKAGEKMTTYVEVARALVMSGYLSETDLEAATTVLADALLVSDVQAAEAAALNDEAFQEAVMAEAEERAVEAAIVGDFEGEILADQMKADAQAAELQDDVIIAKAEATMGAAYREAAAALLAAELIDEANLEAAAEVIAAAWGDADG